MKPAPSAFVSRVKARRTARGLSQARLAELVGVKRQAIYDIESAKYAPNTLLALRLASALGCRVEDLFLEEGGVSLPCTLAAPAQPGARVSLVRLGEGLLAYPLEGNDAFGGGFDAADGIVAPDGLGVRQLCAEDDPDHAIMLLGCDPAFALLGAHVARRAGGMRVLCRFASSSLAVGELAAGMAHVAGTHLHGREGAADPNALLARERLQGREASIVTFSEIEEGLVVAPGNPLGIRSVEELCGGRARLANREPGAALRTLLDELLLGAGLGPELVVGYADTVSSHDEGALRVLHGQADVALGFRAVARRYGLGFVPLVQARCDLVLPKDQLGHPVVRAMLETMQTRAFREDIRALAGYSAERTGEHATDV
ncbi:MAG: substrate-binding domain-containing protein [Desulfovibrionaceae bacterium]